RVLSEESGFETRVVHAGGQADLGTAQPTAIAIHNAASFYFESSSELHEAFDGGGYVYSRFANPTVAAFERAVAELEGADGAVAFSSGMAAIHAAIASLLDGPDGLLVASRDCYGGTQGLIQGPLAALGVQSVLLDFNDAAEATRTFAERPRAVLLETVSNPLLRLVGLPALAAQ